MKVDAKQTVLIAFYIEYQKDIPVMENVNSENIGISQDIFIHAIHKLVNEGYLTNIADCSSDNELNYYTDDALVTRDGIEHVENKLGIERILSAEEKVKKVIEVSGRWGIEQIKDVGVKVLGEIIKTSIGM